MPFPRSRSELGAILIHVAVACVVLIAFTMIVADYGILWVSRSQAQNSADSGALAGAVALAFDSFSDRSDTGPAKVSARTFAVSNGVFGESPDVQMVEDVTFVDCPDAEPPLPPLDETPCIRVAVYRNQDRGNALPTWFGQLVGINDQGVRATAIAEARSGNAVNGMRPWAVPDRWIDNCDEEDPGTPSTPDDDFLLGCDVYDAEGTGYHVPDDVGMQLSFQGGDAHQGGDETHINGGWYQSLDMDGAGVEDYRDWIRSGYGGAVGIGDSIRKENADTVDLTSQATADLIALDPNASWDAARGRIVNSCVGPPYTCSVPGYTQSPRLVPIAVVDIQEYLNGRTSGAPSVHVVKIFGFFVESVGNPQATVTGRLAVMPGLYDRGRDSLNNQSSFLKLPQLVR